MLPDPFELPSNRYEIFSEQWRVGYMASSRGVCSGNQFFNLYVE